MREAGETPPPGTSYLLPPREVCLADSALSAALWALAGKVPFSTRPSLAFDAVFWILAASDLLIFDIAMVPSDSLKLCW